MMKSITLTEPGHFELMDRSVPPPPSRDEVQVRVYRIGICGTDLHAFTGTQPFFRYPRILGHELALEVLDIGDTTLDHSLQVGDRCCVRPYLNCGKCSACLRGLDNCCLNMQVLGVHRDGGMQEIINVPIDKIHHSALLSDDQLALIEMLSIGAHAVRRADMTSGEVVLVIGMGPIGLGVAQFARLAGAQVIVADISDARLAFAKEQNGISHCLDSRQSIVEQLNVLTDGDLPNVVFDATGNASSMMESFNYVAHGGKIVFVGLVQGNISFHDPEFHKRELSVLASRNATAKDFNQVISALENRHLDVKSWITHHATPEQMIEQFPTWLDPASGAIKVMVNFSN
ncbi:MAG: zinc-binding alcohol dehydrogenase family protein [Anaerolineae bacterium]